MSNDSGIRSLYPGIVDEDDIKEQREAKAAVMKRLNVHCSKMLKGKAVDPCNKAPKMHGERLYINEDELVKHKLHLNHYAIQSLEWFMKVKMTRGCVLWPQNESGVRTLKYFKEYDKNSGYSDIILANKKYNLF